MSALFLVIHPGRASRSKKWVSNLFCPRTASDVLRVTLDCGECDDIFDFARQRVHLPVRGYRHVDNPAGVLVLVFHVMQIDREHIV